MKNLPTKNLVYGLAAANAALCWYWTSNACDCSNGDRPILRKLIQLLWMFLGLA